MTYFQERNPGVKWDLPVLGSCKGRRRPGKPTRRYLQSLSTHVNNYEFCQPATCICML